MLTDLNRVGRGIPAEGRAGAIAWADRSRLAGNDWRPLARAVRLQMRYRRAQFRAMTHSGRRIPFSCPPVFLLGCGRSGTTVLGELFSLHPATRYIYEPYDLWSAVDARTDMLHLFTKAQSACILTACDVTPEVVQRFEALFGRLTDRRHVLIEKTPINAMRIGYLDALAPGARFVHIVRDGAEVARSIERLAATNSYRIAGKPYFNQWWGNRDVKWKLLARDGAARGYLPDLAANLDAHAMRGVYEWIVSIGEVDRRRQSLGDRLIELRYADLIETPRECLTELAEKLQLEAPASWIEACAAQVDRKHRAAPCAITLPAALATMFNTVQRRYGFAGRAFPECSPDQPSPRRRRFVVETIHRDLGRA